jgi:hypothetical protein
LSSQSEPRIQAMQETGRDKKQVKEVKFAHETEKLIQSFSFFDEISSSCMAENV